MRFARNLLFSLGTVICVVFGMPNVLIAQTGTATLSGMVTDSSGAAVVKAQLELKSMERGFTTTAVSNNAGIYVFTGIEPGRYQITIRREGFRQIDFLNLVLNTQDHVEQNFRLQVGSVSESVTVDANAEHMETTNPAVGLLVDRTFVENMPLNGRSFQDLIALAPGTVTANSNAAGSSQTPGAFSINGQHDNGNYYVVDGVAANGNPLPAYSSSQGIAGTLPAQTALGTTQSLVSVDALQEFKIQTSGYTAEYGRQPGGQIQLTTRSGTNDIHGSLFDYFRNDALDANDWFFNQNNIAKQAERQNDFGGTVGGPLTIPRLYNGKNKTFYFVSYEGLRLTEPQFSGIQDVPTLAFRQFAAPGLQSFLNATPPPNGPSDGDQCAASLGFTFSCTAQWSAGYSVPSSLDAFSGRLDQAVGGTLQFFVRYSDSPSQQGGVCCLAQIYATSLNAHTWTIGTTARLSATLLDEFRFNYTSTAGSYSSHPGSLSGAIPYPRSLVIPQQLVSSLANGGALVFIPGANFFSVPFYQNRQNTQQQFNILDGLAWTRGSHSLKFGVDYRRLSPLYASAGSYLSLQELSTISDVQQGVASQVETNAFQKAYPVFENLSLYAQDHWKLGLRLTVDSGLRWEFNPPPGASNGIYPLALTAGNLATAQLAPIGTAQYSAIYHDFAPRVGFAYNVISAKSHPTVIRGGVGVFYDTGQAQAASGYLGYPFTVSAITTNVPLPASAASLAPPSLNFPLVTPYPEINADIPDLKLPYTMQWNLSLDEGLGSRNTFTTSYVGNAGRKLLFTGTYGNLGTPNPVNPAFTQVFLTTNAASSSYNALQVQDQGYVAPGLRLIASYTWAHAIDDASSDLGVALAPVRGNSDSDIRQVFNAAMNYQIPGPATSSLVRSVISGWSLDNRFTAMTGYPLDVQLNNLNNVLEPDGLAFVERPDLVPSVPIYLHNQPNALGGWGLNPASFTGTVGDGRTPAGTIPVDANGVPLRPGTLGRNALSGPNFWSLNTAVQRSFPIYERLNLFFRVEAFNILNHPNAGGIDTGLYDSTFGISNNGTQPTVGVSNQLYGTGAARSLQLMLKLQW